MNETVFRGKWAQLKGRIKQQWGKLTNDDLTQIEGSAEAAVGRLQERYGHSREEAQRAWDAFLSRCDKEC
jgi:uncharacterized protein YjbJ (UPF0337 family)